MILTYMLVVFIYKLVERQIKYYKSASYAFCHSYLFRASFMKQNFLCRNL